MTLQTTPDHARHAALIRRCAGLKPAVTAVVHPCDAPSLAAAVEAAREMLIIPVLVGPEAKIRAAAEAAQLDISGFRLLSTAHSHAAAEQAVKLAAAGEV
ncbi:MAG: bifunctional enoyl-CoA hydratase/phosphate acetyltransferase, partial [Rhizomicrobium sp.]